ncbi:ATP-dependent RNA helicase SPB4 NDAI_0C06300 [Naumovozyma dairenensis CBS 421]|uniref:ATP-dependent RNA helicase n=1 Tax=Naumovozyma dairenensis (strain ATCC 10597 / BCRC 20456 / CBS 421 / NBRC 0211 / NRRL Y-12639) TaxID=1071378 RepID=G0W928_NAUDC|nr:hypothetical protein NDAI_0C06300 [Naumovozyma dairenensis CBS 421]CCD24289.1 hypothetical protein NDAI_0C06300 [Naumovozyma dairenensis CBS 421]
MSRSSLQWDDLKCPIQPWIRTAIDVMGFDQMTPVQASTIPMFSQNKDVVVESVTGSGKTVAFVIPVLERIISEGANKKSFKKGHFHSLIISPTRELAKQTKIVIDEFLKQYPDDMYPIKAQLLVGTNENTVRDDVNDFLENKPQILVGTPGRLLDFLQMTSVKTSSCGMVIIDEADRLLDISFVKDVEKILSVLPKQRRTGLFSATISSAGDSIFKTGLRNPVKIKVNSKNVAPSLLKLNYVVVDPELKFQYLLNLLNNYRFKKCIVYFPTCISVTYFYSFMQYLQNEFKNSKHPFLNEDLQIFSLHGKLQTASRMKTLDSFTETLTNAVLLTTDVAARGIDIPDVDLVVQLDPPTDSDIFLHRCGRTGRANRIGQAITFLNKGREEDFVTFMQVKNVELEEINNLELINPCENFYDIFKKWILQDRARFDHSIKAFVAFIRYYSNHSASSIFRLQSLNYVAICKMHGLFRLPRMPEITKYLKDDPENPVVFADGWLVNPPINLDNFAYADKKREKKRLDELKRTQDIHDKKKLKYELKKKNMAWSNKTETKETKAERRLKMSIKRKAIEEQLAKEEANNSSGEEVEQDWKDVIMQTKKRKTASNDVQGAFDDL